MKKKDLKQNEKRKELKKKIKELEEDLRQKHERELKEWDAKQQKEKRYHLSHQMRNINMDHDSDLLFLAVMQWFK